MIAPLFFFVVAGVPAALAYRACNTLDAMIGYHGDTEWLGKAAARLDDALNLVPARVTAALVVVASALAGASPVARLGDWRRDGARTESPNAGRPMAAMAGAVGVQLEKVGHYRLGDGAVRRARRRSRAPSPSCTSPARWPRAPSPPWSGSPMREPSASEQAPRASEDAPRAGEQAASAIEDASRASDAPHASDASTASPEPRLEARALPTVHGGDAPAGVLDCSTGVSPLPPPAPVLAALRAADVTRYPHPTALPLRRAIAARHAVDRRLRRRRRRLGGADLGAGARVRRPRPARRLRRAGLRRVRAGGAGERRRGMVAVADVA